MEGEVGPTEGGGAASSNPAGGGGGTSGTPSQCARTIFKQLPFPDPIGGKLKTAPFLDAARGVVSLVERLGKVFAAVRYDMNGNIQKINSKFQEDTVKFEFLNDMLLLEQAEGGSRAAEALLWLRRALHFIHNFLRSVCEDAKAPAAALTPALTPARPEDLSQNVQTAYRETLESHHGWMAHRLFNVLSKLIPCRSQLLKTMAMDAEKVPEDILLAEVEEFLNNLNSNITILTKFYLDHKLEQL